MVLRGSLPAGPAAAGLVVGDLGNCLLDADHVEQT